MGLVSSEYCLEKNFREANNVVKYHCKTET